MRFVKPNQEISVRKLKFSLYLATPDEPCHVGSKEFWLGDLLEPTWFSHLG
jgi:hypothetical protein